jgi:hypothetical protein
VSPEDLLSGLRQTLIEISQRRPTNVDQWNESRVLQLAVMKLWIDAGNYAELYRRAIGVPVATDPWTDLVAYRGVLAHALPSEVNLARVYAESGDVQRILDEVNEAAQH